MCPTGPDGVQGDGAVIISYNFATGPITVDFGAGTVTGDGNDTFTNIYGIEGSQFDDLYISGSGDDVIQDSGDTISYVNATSGVTVHLYDGTATGDGNDSIGGVVNVIGSAHNDTIEGNDEFNVLDGGTGTDTVSFTHGNGVTADLAAGLASGGQGDKILLNFENITGSGYDDTLYGDSGVNTISAGGGNDSISGGGGADTLTGGTGTDTFIFKAIEAMTASVDITDFSTAQSDKLDLTNLLSGHYDPVHDAIADFVSFSTSSGNTHVSVDLDGTGSSYSATQIASLIGVTGLNVSTMIGNGELIVPT